MKILLPPTNTNYRLLDSGNGLKLEQYGANIIVRPDSSCVWLPHTDPKDWKNVSARYIRRSDGEWVWKKEPSFKEPWLFSYHLPFKSQAGPTSVVCSLHFSQSKNIGIFPEQAANWEWTTKAIQSVSYSPTVLNLFAYTGMSTLCAAAAGATVCHVDASTAAVTWAKQNQTLSKLDHTPVRWIVDDCLEFIAREARRDTKYDAIILDPPAFGRNPKGKIFEFEKNINQLLAACKTILKDKPLFVLFNGYGMGLSAVALKNLLIDHFPACEDIVECGELHLAEAKRNRTLGCSIYARFCTTKK